MTIRVLVADAEEHNRARIVDALSAEDDIEVVAQCADGVDVLTRARRLRPDVVLVDVTLPRLGGLEVVRRLADEPPPRPVAVLVAPRANHDQVHLVLRYGEGGFVAKDAGSPCVVQAVRVAAGGASSLVPEPTLRLLQRLAAPGRQDAHGAAELTAREREVTRLVARGLTNQEIATELFVSVSTVKTHLGNVQSKLGARNRVEIAAWAWEADGPPPIRVAGGRPGAEDAG